MCFLVFTSSEVKKVDLKTLESNETIVKSNVKKDNKKNINKTEVENIVKINRKEKIFKKTFPVKKPNFTELKKFLHDLSFGLECEIEIKCREKKLNINYSGEIFFEIPYVDGGITFYPLYDLKGESFDWNSFPQSAYMNFQHEIFRTEENYFTFLYNQIGVYDSNLPESFQFDEDLLAPGNTLSFLNDSLEENYSVDKKYSDKYHAFGFSGQRECSDLENTFSNFAASLISKENKIETLIFSWFLGKNLNVFNINIALNLNFWLSGQEIFNKWSENFKKIPNSDKDINKSISGAANEVKNFDFKVFDFSFGFFHNRFFSLYVEGNILYFHAKIDNIIKLRDINDIKIKGSLVLSEFIREILEETFWNDLLKKISFGVYGEMSLFLTKILFFWKIFMLKIEFEKNKNEKWNTSFTIDYKDSYIF